MFALLLLVLVPSVIFAYKVCEIHNDYAGTENEEKSTNDCTIEDYKFFDEYVNNNIRNN